VVEIRKQESRARNCKRAGAATPVCAVQLNGESACVPGASESQVDDG
jgi:hypothetical protein